MSDQSDILFVSYDSKDGHSALMVGSLVCTRGGGTHVIIRNEFVNKKADDIYKLLTTIKEDNK